MANLRHNNKYRYIEGTFENSHTKTLIVCPLHGEFLQVPRKHVHQGQGCPKCGKVSLWEDRKLSTSEYIEKVLKVHGNGYTYNLCQYKNSRENVIIICSKHGIFEQNAHLHLLGQGCPKCRYLKSAQSNIDNVKDLIIDRFRKVHKDLYDYSQIDYRGNKKRVNIICRLHGVFKQTPGNHILGAGCPLCYNKSRGESIINNFLKDRGIVFERQKKFEGCINKRKLPFDFFIPSLNTCIEYDGLFHFKPIFSITSFTETKINDEIKNNFCKKANINLIRIPYTTKDPLKLLKIIIP